MAENETDDVLEEMPNDVLEEVSDDDLLEETSPEEESSEKKGLSKPTIIKIAVAVTVVLLLTVGGYFLFFLNKDFPETKEESSQSVTVEEPAQPENTMTEEDTQGTEENENEQQMIELPEISDDTFNEGFDLKDVTPSDTVTEKPKDLTGTEEDVEKQQAQKQETSDALPITNNEEVVSQPNEDKTSIATENKLSESAIIKQQTQLKSEHYQTIYGEDTRGYPWTRPAKTPPAPKPKWGEFDRLSNKK